MYSIEPLEKYFPIAFAESLTENDARTRLHRGLVKWGETEMAWTGPKIRTEILEDGTEIKFAEPRSREELAASQFVLDSFYNLCCLGSYHQTIEELVFWAHRYRLRMPAEKASRDAFLKLIGISQSFLIAEWAQEILYRAVSNRDEKLFKGLSRWVIEDIPSKRFITAKTWLGTTLLWYLGGKDMRPRTMFMELCQEKGVVSSHIEPRSFRSMLSNLGLIRGQRTSK